MLYDLERKPRKLKIKLLDEVLCFVQEYLKLPEETHILLEFSNMKKDGANGYCVDCDDDEDYDCEIEINNKLDIDEMITTIFHELVHVKQYVTGRLISGVGKKHSRWDGIPYSGTYLGSPWEKQAYATEKRMFNKWCNQHNG